MDTSDGNLLVGEPFEDPAYAPSRYPSVYNPLHTYELPKGAEKHYQQQFADMYFLRLTQLREAVIQRAQEAWADFTLGDERAQMVDRVLDVRQGELCWVVGTVYMELGMKPNVLDDIAKEHWIVAPPDRVTYMSGTKKDEMMLEDESGRLKVTGESLHEHYVTGCVLAALGTEQADGTFQVIATQHADLPRQPQRYERDDSSQAVAQKPRQKREKAGKLAIVSGLEMTGRSDDDISLDLLSEYLTGESTASPDQAKAAHISRLIIAGDSMSRSTPILSREDFMDKKAGKKGYGYDATSYNASPTGRFDVFLTELLPAIPITLLPGPSDPSNVALPQQPLHPALFPQSRAYANPPVESTETKEGLDSVTNPWEGDIDGWRVLATGGQTVADLLKYVADVNVLDVMESMLRWRCVAPTAPDTLWCYPFQDDDPLLVKDCPHIYIAGNQPRFQKRVIEGPAGQRVLLLAVPKFRTKRVMVVVDMESLEVEIVKFSLRRPAKAAKAAKAAK